jgi:hypothetical protein
MITKQVLQKLKPQTKPYFLRSHRVTGLGLKVNPSGSIKFVVETKHIGRSHRKTIGTYPVMSLSEAEKEALLVLRQIHSGCAKPKDLSTLLIEYTKRVSLKTSTLKSYQEVIGFYLKDWLNVSVSDITKQMVEKRFIQIRDKGISTVKQS